MTAKPTHGLCSTAPSTSASEPTKPSVPGKPTLARPSNKKLTARSGMFS
jgi:hypothetical protein